MSPVQLVLSEPKTQPSGSGGASPGGAEKYLSRTSEAGACAFGGEGAPRSPPRSPGSLSGTQEGAGRKQGLANHMVQAPRRVSQFSSEFPGALNTPGVTELVSPLPRRVTALAVRCRSPGVSFQEVSAVTFAKLRIPLRDCQLHFCSFAPNQTEPRRDAHL